MKLAALDLNLLVVFDAVMRERSVTRAAAQLGLSQPALSHALTRLRHALKDELFLRTPAGMVPTPRAERLAEPVREALDALRTAVEPSSFAPETAERSFRVAVDNAAAIVLAPRLVAAVAAAAPGVRLDLRPAGTLDVEALMERGELDLAVRGREPDSARFAWRVLYEDRFVLVLRCGGPAAARPLDAAGLAALRTIEISSSGDDLGFLDAWLGEQGLRRQVAHRAPYLSAAALLASSDLAAVMRGRVAAAMLRHHPELERLDLPGPAPAPRSMLVWHRRLDAQPAHRWLRGVLVGIAAGL